MSISTLHFAHLKNAHIRQIIAPATKYCNLLSDGEVERDRENHLGCQDTTILPRSRENRLFLAGTVLFCLLRSSRRLDSRPEVPSFGQDNGVGCHLVAFLVRRENHTPDSRLAPRRLLLSCARVLLDFNLGTVTGLERGSAISFAGLCESCRRLDLDLLSGYKLRTASPDTFYPGWVGCNDRACLDHQGPQ